MLSLPEVLRRQRKEDEGKEYHEQATELGLIRPQGATPDPEGTPPPSQPACPGALVTMRVFNAIDYLPSG